MKPTGRVTCVTYKAMPPSVTTFGPDEVLAAIGANHFAEATVIDEGEVGWVGEHLADTNFNRVKNIFGDIVLMNMRIDTHKPPGKVKQSVLKQQEEAAIAASDAEFLSKAEKRIAREEADKILHDMKQTGLFRKSKMVPVMWNFKLGVLYVGADGVSVAEKICELMMQTFNVGLIMRETPGDLVERFLAAHSDSDQVTDMNLHPTGFTEPPMSTLTINPICDWVSDGNLYDYLGNEFLIWLWHAVEMDEGLIEALGRDYIVLIDAYLRLSCAWGQMGQMASKGDCVHRAREVGEALEMGKWPRQAGVILATGDSQWECKLKGESFSIGGAMLPSSEDAATPREVMEHRIKMVVELRRSLHDLFHHFLTIRLHPTWPSFQEKITNWIHTRQDTGVAV